MLAKGLGSPKPETVARKGAEPGPECAAPLALKGEWGSRLRAGEAAERQVPCSCWQRMGQFTEDLEETTEVLIFVGIVVAAYLYIQSGPSAPPPPTTPPPSCSDA